MKIYCTDTFKKEFDKLIKNNSYKSLQKKLISYFFNKSIDELRSGTNLNNNAETPYIKKRIGGRGGFRCYFLLIIKKDKLYLMFVHPKSGSKGSSNTLDDARTEFLEEVCDCIEKNNLYELELNEDQTKIIFNWNGQKTV